MQQNPVFQVPTDCAGQDAALDVAALAHEIVGRVAVGDALHVLLHRGKGGGLSSLFGGGVSSSIGGSSVAERNLDRLTVVLGLIWTACIVAVGLLVPHLA